MLNYLWKKIYRQGACSDSLRHLSPSTSKKPEEGFFCPAGPSIVETPPQENMKPLKSWSVWWPSLKRAVRWICQLFNLYKLVPNFMKRPFYSTRVEDNLHWNWLIHPINLSQSEFVFHSNIKSRNYIFLTSQKWPNFNHVTQKRSKNSTVPKLNLYHFLTLIQ